MGLLHTWGGVLFSGLLFAIFWTGSLSVFDQEIDRWMMPDTRIVYEADSNDISIDRDLRPLLEERAYDSPAWTILLPREREPFVTLAYGSLHARKAHRDRFHPATLEQISSASTAGASGFLYPLHHNLTLRYGNMGAWVVGLAGMAMLILLVSGIIIHRKLLADLFTFRPRKAVGRSTLDLHNLTGVLPLPFHVLITLSGLIVAFSIYFPAAHTPLYGDDVVMEKSVSSGLTPERVFMAESLGKQRLPPTGDPGDTSSLDAMVEEAEAEWGDGTVYLIRVNYPKDAGGNVVLRRSSDDSLLKIIDNFRFANQSGQPMEHYRSSAVVDAWNLIAGLHYVEFRHWPLRWLYFLGGIAGCVCIATGLFFYLNKRRKRDDAGMSAVEATSIAAITGVLVATAAFLVANRLIPAEIAGKEVLEKGVFWTAWIAALVHAAWRGRQRERLSVHPAWREQCLVLSALTVTAVVLNWLTTGDHLPATLFHYWPVAAVDLGLIAVSGLAWLAGRRLGSSMQGAETVRRHRSEEAS